MTVGDPVFLSLEGDAAQAVAHRGGHIQTIAAAGSGKTEVVARVADLIATGVEPRSIVAFTFTEKASAELKDVRLLCEDAAS
jgi:DNA helicase-2/ATP-dependent DNA helicase PcrA